MALNPFAFRPAYFRTGFKHLPAEAMTGGRKEDFFVFELAGLKNLLGLCPGMGDGDDYSKRFAVERLSRYPWLIERQCQNHGIQLPVLQHETERGSEILFELQRHFRCAFMKNLGRYMVTKNPEDVGAFKTPTLREISRTAPYMHDGRFKTLAEVVEFYNGGGIKNPYLDNTIIPLELTEQEKGDLVMFLRSLNGEGWQHVKAPTTFPR
jgi:hypothetical protein